jgi:hypothetical protein
MVDTSRERALEGALFALYQAWSRLPIPPGKKRRYYANYIRQMFTPGCKRYIGGVATVKHVIHKQTSGLERLKGHPELTVENLVLSREWDGLFDDSDRKSARQNLSGNSK